MPNHFHSEPRLPVQDNDNAAMLFCVRDNMQGHIYIPGWCFYEKKRQSY